MYTFCISAVFPPYLDWGSPRRHHLVIHFHIALNPELPGQDHRSLSATMTLQEEEVDAAVWLSRKQVQVLTYGLDSEGKMPAGIEETLKMVFLDGEEQPVYSW